VDDHTRDTPVRVARSFLELLSGYQEDPGDHLATTFPGPAASGLVVCRGIRFTSLCAHHLLPFTGVATVAYLPDDGAPIVGLSKLARVVEGFARRLQTQESLAAEVTEAIAGRLKTVAAGCVITAHHACMGIRGVRQPDAEMVTSSLTGRFRTDPAARAELRSLHPSPTGGTP
jgi:GTP cyclohydrolase IA